MASGGTVGALRTRSREQRRFPAIRSLCRASRGTPDGKRPNAHRAAVRCLRPIPFVEGPPTRGEGRCWPTNPRSRGHPTPLISFPPRQAARPCALPGDGTGEVCHTRFLWRRKVSSRAGLWSGNSGLADLFVRVGDGMSAGGRCQEVRAPLSSRPKRSGVPGRDDPSPPRLPVRPQG